MAAPARIDDLRYEIEDPEYVRSGEDFRPNTRLYDVAVLGTIHLYIDGAELTHGNKLPARFDVTDTARAQLELLQSLASGGTASGEPFCCSCGDRGCAYIHWEMESTEGAEIRWQMEDLGQTKIGEHGHLCSFEAVRGLVEQLHRWLIEFVKDREIENLKGSESATGTRENDSWSISGLQERCQGIGEFRLPEAN